MFLRILWSYIEYFFNAQIENDKITYFLSLDIQKDEIYGPERQRQSPNTLFTTHIWRSSTRRITIKIIPFLFILVIRVPYFLF